MQAVSLYRGENIIEDSNVIFVRDFNLPTYLDADSEHETPCNDVYNK